MNTESYTDPVDPEIDVRLTAMVLGEASDFEAAQLHELMAQRPELAAWYMQLQSLHGALSDIALRESSEPWQLPTDRRASVIALLESETQKTKAEAKVRRSDGFMALKKGFFRFRYSIAAVTAASLLVFATLLSLNANSRVRTVASVLRSESYKQDKQVAKPMATSSESESYLFSDEGRNSLYRNSSDAIPGLTFERGYAAPSAGAPAPAAGLPPAPSAMAPAATPPSPPAGPPVITAAPAASVPLNKSETNRWDESGAADTWAYRETKRESELGESFAGKKIAPDNGRSEFESKVDDKRFVAPSDANSAFGYFDSKGGTPIVPGIQSTPEPPGGSLKQPLTTGGAEVDSTVMLFNDSSRPEVALTNPQAAGKPASPNMPTESSLALGSVVDSPDPFGEVDKKEMPQLRFGLEKQDGLGALADLPTDGEGQAASADKFLLGGQASNAPSSMGGMGGGMGGMGGMGGGGMMGGDATDGSGWMDGREMRVGKSPAAGGRWSGQGQADDPKKDQVLEELAQADSDGDDLFGNGEKEWSRPQKKSNASRGLQTEAQGIPPQRVDVTKRLEDQIRQLNEEVAEDEMMMTQTPKILIEDEVTEEMPVAREKGRKSLSSNKDNKPTELDALDGMKQQSEELSVLEESYRLANEFESKQNELSKTQAARRSSRGRVQLNDAERKTNITQGLNETLTETERFSTFSLHISDVSFKLALDSLSKGEWPEAAKIRLEEFLNAFDYQDPLPSNKEQVACRVEQAIHPFLMQRNVLRVAMRTSALGRNSATPLSLTFLLDNSGSMQRADRAQTIRRAFETLAHQLSPNDRVTLISFASTPRLLADQVSGAEAMNLVEMIDRLPSEGGTNLEAALQLAMEKSLEHKTAGAQNRVILLTDGAVNLGDAKPESLASMVVKLRENGVAFDAAGISAQDLNDEVLETLTRQGDGRYYLLDSAESADEGFAKQIAGALRPSAKNVKVQVEFNPLRVARYKLLGFEKHLLKQEDFRNDKVDAAELAAAEAGVALYQYEAMADGSGDIGSVSVRFQDMTTGLMVEKRWPIPYETNPARIEDANPSLRLATSAVMFAAHLRGEPLGENVELKSLAEILAGLPSNLNSTERVQQLSKMIEMARQISGASSGNR
jgi:Mg-chelatase subunit ChlD